jgi:hypothetical protein
MSTSTKQSHLCSIGPHIPYPFPYFLFPVFFLSLFSCNSIEKADQLPIPQERVVSIMVDMHLAESAANMKLTDIDSTQPSYAQLCEAIFAKNGTTRARFDSTLLMLSQDPKAMNAVYDVVLERLSELDGEVKARHD